MITAAVQAIVQKEPPPPTHHPLLLLLSQTLRFYARGGINPSFLIHLAAAPAHFPTVEIERAAGITQDTSDWGGGNE